VNAKVRTGGVTPEAIPSPETVVRFMRACIAARVPFKRRPVCIMPYAASIG
jgi:hypothetical protein